MLRNIAGPVNVGIKRYNAASKLKRSSSSGEGDRRGEIQPYDFLDFPSANFSTTPSQPSKIRGIENLDSGEVSELVSDGMVLWQSLEEPEAEASDEGQSAPTSREEEAVKIMLLD